MGIRFPAMRRIAKEICDDKFAKTLNFNGFWTNVGVDSQKGRPVPASENKEQR